EGGIGKEIGTKSFPEFYSIYVANLVNNEFLFRCVVESPYPAIRRERKAQDGAHANQHKTPVGYQGGNNSDDSRKHCELKSRYVDVINYAQRQIRRDF